MFQSKFFEQGETNLILNEKSLTLISESENWSGGSDMFAVFLPLARWDCALNSHSGHYIFAFFLCTSFLILIEVSKWADSPSKKS